MISFQAFAAFAMWPLYACANRIRAWGSLPVPRGPTLCLVNHQHDLDDQVTVAYLERAGPWNKTIYVVTSRRLFERGALAWPFPLLEPLLRTADSSRLFSLVGMVPIENDIRKRPLTSLARAVIGRHGDLPLTQVFKGPVLAALGIDPSNKRLHDILSSTLFRRARGTDVPVKWLYEPYLGELFAEMHESVEGDMRALEERLKHGATIWLAPEGRHSKTGRMGEMRTALRRLAPLAEQIFTIAISYDVFVGHRLSMILRVLPALDRDDLPNSMKAPRPVTVSQLLADWLCADGLAQQRGGDSAAFSEGDAIDAVRERVAALPQLAWVEPDLRASPERMTKAALRGLVRRGIARSSGAGYALTDKRDDRRFPKTRDVISHQAAFFDESAAAWRALAAREG